MTCSSVMEEIELEEEVQDRLVQAVYDEKPFWDVLGRGFEEVEGSGKNSFRLQRESGYWANLPAALGYWTEAAQEKAEYEV